MIMLGTLAGSSFVRTGGYGGPRHSGSNRKLSARATPSSSSAIADPGELRRAGLAYRRPLGGYALTRCGNRYLRAALPRYKELQAEMRRQIDLWEADEVTKRRRHEALVELVRRAWERDCLTEAEVLASLHAGRRPASS